MSENKITAYYNITNNRLFLWPNMPKGQKLPPEQYEKIKGVHMQWWPRGCFTCIWTPDAEDVLIEIAGEIQEDDTPDDVERRVERYERYAETAEETAENATERITSGRAHTARQVRLAEGTLESAAEKAEHWHSRIEGAIAHAKYKDRPDVIVRRIEGIEKQLRDNKKYFDQVDGPFHYKSSPEEKFYYVGKGRAASVVKVERLPAIQARCQRWIDHLNKRLEYETAYLEAVGGDPRKVVADIAIGDIVEFHGEEWEVRMTGKKNIRLYREPNYWRLVGREEITKVIRKSEVKEKRAIIRRKAPDDGIKKGVMVTWELKLSTGPVSFTTKVISVGLDKIKVEPPPADNPEWKKTTWYGDKYVERFRKNVKLAQV